jgi:hypothetical protein
MSRGDILIKTVAKSSSGTFQKPMKPPTPQPHHHHNGNDKTSHKQPWVKRNLHPAIEESVSNTIKPQKKEK